MTADVLKTYRVSDGSGRVLVFGATEFRVDMASGLLSLYVRDEVIAVFQHWHSIVDVVTTWRGGVDE